MSSTAHAILASLAPCRKRKMFVMEYFKADIKILR